MIVGKKLIGDDAGKYLPFALSKLRFMVTQYTGAMQSRTIRADDATILLELNDADHGQVTIWALGGAGYQFFTTGAALAADANGIFKGYAISVTLKKGVITAKAAGSTLEADTEDPPRWLYSATAQQMTRFLPYKESWQIQAIPEHAYYPDGKADKVLLSCWTAARDAPNMAGYGGGVNYGPFFTDIHYDISPCLYPKGQTEPSGAHGLVPDADWYKRAATRTVTSEQFGSRSFIILTDACSNFVIYPIVPADQALYDSMVDSPYYAQHIKTNVPAGIAQTIAPPLPSWVETYYLGATAARDYTDDALVQLAIPAYVWKFNSSATKAAAIAFHALTAASNTSVSEVRPGLVEFNIGITLTGPNPEDFSAALTLAREIDPTSSSRYLAAVDYAWPVPGAAVLDDLIVLEGEVFYPHDPDPDSSRVIPAWNACYARFGVHNETTGKRVRNITIYNNRRSWPVTTEDVLGNDYVPYKKRLDTGQATGAVESTMILALDLRIQACVLQRRTDTVQSVGAETWSSTEMQLETYAYNALVEAKSLDPSTAVDSHYDDVSTTSTYRYAADRTGTSGDYLQARGFVNQVVLEAGYPLYDNSVDATVPTGAMLHNLLFACMPGVAHETFAVHPEGHWSVATLPSFFFKGAGSGFPSGASWVQYNAANPDANVNLIRAAANPGSFHQDFVDIVSFKPKSGARVTTNHIALFNQAYGKTLTKADFLYSFSVTNGPSVLGNPGNTATFIEASRGGRSYAYEIDSALAGGSSINDAGVYFSAFTTYRMEMLDPRRQVSSMLENGDGYGMNDSYFRQSPVLRGGSLFYGATP